MIDALSPLDGRYEQKILSLRPFFSEHALMKYRLIVEIRYFIMLSEQSDIKDLPKLNASQKKALMKIVDDFDLKAIEY
jgi:adenylosuccinate lyase